MAIVCWTPSLALRTEPTKRTARHVHLPFLCKLLIKRRQIRMKTKTTARTNMNLTEKDAFGMACCDSPLFCEIHKHIWQTPNDANANKIWARNIHELLGFYFRRLHAKLLVSHGVHASCTAPAMMTSTSCAHQAHARTQSHLCLTLVKGITKLITCFALLTEAEQLQMNNWTRPYSYAERSGARILE